jgi:hypothetical protein
VGLADLRESFVAGKRRTDESQRARRARKLGGQAFLAFYCNAQRLNFWLDAQKIEASYAHNAVFPAKNLPENLISGLAEGDMFDHIAAARYRGQVP